MVFSTELCFAPKTNKSPFPLEWVSAIVLRLNYNVAIQVSITDLPVAQDSKKPIRRIIRPVIHYMDIKQNLFLPVDSYPSPPFLVYDGPIPELLCKTEEILPAGDHSVALQIGIARSAGSIIYQPQIVTFLLCL